MTRDQRKADPMITDQIIKQAESWHEQISAKDVTQAVRSNFRVWYECAVSHQQAYAQVFMCREEDVAFPELPEPVAVQEAGRAVLFKWAAVAAAVLVALIGLNNYVMTPEIKEYSTQIAEVRNIQLDDGTLITLGASSRISVAEFSKRERRVFLEEGEALFDVAHNARTPFIVKSGKTEIRVLGTRFNMNRAAGYLAVSLLEGKIDVQQETPDGLLSFLEEGAHVTLHPAQMVTVKKGVLAPPESREIKRMANWVDGKLSYFNAPLSVVVSDINRYSRTPLRIEGSALGALPVTAVFGADQIDIMVEGLAQILPITITRHPAGYYIIRSKKSRRI